MEVEIEWLANTYAILFEGEFFFYRRSEYVSLTVHPCIHMCVYVGVLMFVHVRVEFHSFMETN